MPPEEKSSSPDPVDRRQLADLAAGRRHRAEIVFGVLSFGVALFLLSQIGAETTSAENRPFIRQPAFWPTVAILGMLVFGAFELGSTWRALRTRQSGAIGAEVIRWLLALEYFVWFLAYVWAVPLLGYLPTTILFCAALGYRLGYRRRRALLAAVLTGLGTVVLFKSILGVKIPGGILYEYLPDGIRNALILYF